VSQDAPKVELSRRQKFAKKTQWITWLAFALLALAGLASVLRH
jgi:hypothetical protein